jgi:hypothetical protein
VAENLTRRILPDDLAEGGLEPGAPIGVRAE